MDLVGTWCSAPLSDLVPRTPLVPTNHLELGCEELGGAFVPSMHKLVETNEKERKGKIRRKRKAKGIHLFRFAVKSSPGFSPSPNMRD